MRFLGCALILVVSVAVWAQQGQIDFSYHGALPGDRLNGDIHYSGRYTQHENYWDYCYLVSLSNLSANNTFTISVPVPVTPVLEGKSYVWYTSAITQGSATVGVSYSTEETPGWVICTVQTGSGQQVIGTVWFQFYSSAPPQRITPGCVRKKGEGCTFVIHEPVYTNPEPGSLVLGGLSLVLVGVLRRRKES